MQWKGGTTGMFSDDFSVSNLICHRIPERTFNIHGIYFPVCARCTGFYLGAFSYFIYAYFFYIDYTIYLVSLGILMMIPTFLDGFTQLGGSRMSNNTLRLLTGLLGGVGLAIVVKAIKWVVITSL
jgi:uncharacterized membrane protein